MKKGFVILCLLPLLFACGDIENCDTDQNLELMIVRFFDLESQAPKKVGFSMGTGSIFYGSSFFSSDSTFVVLPLDPNEESVNFFFISDTSSHQLEVSYTKEFSIFDPDCDPSLTFTNLDTVQQTFDSTVVVNATTNIVFDRNIEIYF